MAGFGPQFDPMMFTAPFQVDAPSPENLVTSLTTDQSTYALGAPVNMTFTETNEGDQPIPVLTGPTDFQISENGTAVWNSASGIPHRHEGAGVDDPCRPDNRTRRPLPGMDCRTRAN